MFLVMMLLTFTFRLKVKSPYFLRFIHRKQVLYHQLTLKNSPHVTQLLGQKRNDDFYNRGISVSFFFSNAKQNNDTERLWYCCILWVTKQRKYAQISLNYLSWKIYFKEHNWEMENKMQFMNDWQGPLTSRRCKKASLMLRNERSQTRQ